MNSNDRSRAGFRLAILAFFIFFVLGYRQHELLLAEKKLRLEIDSLQARRAGLLNLERMEKIAVEKLGYQYPEPGQIIKVVENGDE
jgi:cell division protein FtsL